MKQLTILLIFLSLAACGGSTAGADNEPLPGGVFFAPDYQPLAEEMYAKLQACSGIDDYPLESIRLEVSPYSFPCSGKTSCIGYFTPPNKIRIVTLQTFKHEALHYFLFMKNGDPDEHHENRLFEECA